MTNWNEHRRFDQTIDLKQAFAVEFNVDLNQYPAGTVLKSLRFLDNIENMQKIVSRQAAAVALAQAWEIHYEDGR